MLLGVFHEGQEQTEAALKLAVIETSRSVPWMKVSFPDAASSFEWIEEGDRTLVITPDEARALSVVLWRLAEAQEAGE